MQASGGAEEGEDKNIYRAPGMGLYYEVAVVVGGGGVDLLSFWPSMPTQSALKKKLDSGPDDAARE